MEIIDLINRIIKDCIINIFTYVVFIKIINYKQNDYKKMIIIVILSIIEAVLGVGIAQSIGIVPGILLCYFLHSLVSAKITYNKFKYSIILTFISLAIAYVTYIISVIMASFVLKTILPNINLDNILILFLAIIIESIIIYRFFKIKRFRNGISFLQDKDKVNNIGIFGFAFCGIAVLIFAFFGDFRTYQFSTFFAIGIIIEAICITIWIRTKITKHYKQNLRRNQIKALEETITAKDKEISRITKENNAIATINHKYSSRIKSLERISAKIFTSPEIIEKMKTEFGEEFGELEEQIKKISEEYTKEIEEKVKHENKLDKTGIFGIDNILEYLREEAEKENIKFELKLNASINYMIEKIIDQSRLETLLGDHIKDAIIAIKHSNNTYRSILVVIGIIDDCYEIKIYDTGIEFEIETLIKLGTEAITTHKETGGSGIGFMTTFETLKATKASLIIEEKHPMNNTDYTKSVAIRFDGKSEYRIQSYRAEKIEKQKGERDIKVNV